MKSLHICRITRPPLKELTEKFPQREHHILGRLGKAGHKVSRYSLRPVKLPGKYLSYSAGLIISIFKFYRVRADVIIADNMEAAFAAVIIKLIFRTPFVFDFIDDYSLIARDDNFKIRYHLIEFFKKRLPGAADLIIVVDEHKKRYCNKIGIEDNKIVFIPNGTDTEKFRPDIPCGGVIREMYHPDNRIVAYAGRINRYYKVDAIVGAVPDVVKRFPDVKFVFVGDGDDMEGIKKLVRMYDVENSVFLAGFRHPDEIPQLLSCADVCIFPLPDSSALAVYEYMALGKPTVIPEYSTEMMGINDDILPDDCILKVAGTSSGFADGVTLLLENNEMRCRMGKQARKFVENNYTWDKLTAVYEFALTAVAGSMPLDIVQ